MLYMIAQPTRKNPELLPRYEDLYKTGPVKHKKDMSGGDILAELMK